MGSDLLAARDGRHQLLLAALSEGFPATVAVALNIPGPVKMRPGASALFHRVRLALPRLLGPTDPLAAGCDRLGPFALLGVSLPPVAVKEICIGVEATWPAGRLLDLDVYDQAALPLDRTAFSLPPRPCLLCRRPAAECRRLGRHSLAALLEEVDALLAHFCA